MIGHGPARQPLGSQQLCLSLRGSRCRHPDDCRALNWISIPVALFIGTIGAASVFEAVYIDVGGDSNVPLGFVLLTENVMMGDETVWMLVMILTGTDIGHAM